MDSSADAADLVNVQQKMALLDQLLANYNQLYKTYLQEVESDVNKKQRRKYPYNIKTANEFDNVITPEKPFPDNGTEEACFKSCVDTANCRYALYSNSGCGIDCNPNKCLLYGENAGGIVPVAEVPSTVPSCPASSNEVTTWCKKFNNPFVNAIIPVLVLRKGNTDWRTLAGQMPKSTAKPEDAPLTVDLTTNLQTWSPDSQFSDVNTAPGNQISLQFRYFAEYWLNAYGLQSGSTLVIAGQGAIGTYSFSRLTGQTEKIMYGPWIGRDVPVQNVKMLNNNVTVYIIEDGQFTKMVSSDGQEKYYTGRMNDFNPSSWNTYSSTGGGMYLLKNGSTVPVTAIPNETQNMTGYRGKPGIFSINIKGAIGGGTVWGTDTYTDDSNIRMAAVHAGVVQNGETKTVQIKMLPEQASYAGSSRNSVSTSSYGRWGGSYKFIPINTGESYVGSFGGQTMFWTSNNPTTGGAAAGAQTAVMLASNIASKKFKYNYSAFEKPVWDIEQNVNAMMGELPPQLAQSSVPSWQFLGLHDSAASCQTAAMNDPSYVYTTATYFNASYSNPKNGKNVFARSCYGNVAGAPTPVNPSARDTNVQTMTPPYGYTKLGGKNGITILKQMYQLNKQIMALTDDLKLSNDKIADKANAKANANPTKEGFEQQSKSTTPTSGPKPTKSIEEISNQLKQDQEKLSKTLSKNNYLDADLVQSNRLLLQSRVKMGVGILLGVFMAYLAYRLFTSSSSPKNDSGDASAAIAGAIGAGAGAAATNSIDTDAGAGADGMVADMDMDTGMNAEGMNGN